MNTTAKPLSGYLPGVERSLLGEDISQLAVVARLFVLFAIVMFALASPSAWAEADSESPEEVVARYLRVAISTTLKAGHSATSDDSGFYAAYRAMAPTILQTHDLQLSREMALGGGKDGGKGLASQFSESQAERLEDAYIRLMIGKRVRLMLTQGWLRFEPAVRHRLKGGRTIIWVSLYLRDGAKQSIGFILQRESAVSGAVWRIINTQFGHFSELAEQRVRYQRLVQTGGPEALLSALEQRLERLQ